MMESGIKAGQAALVLNSSVESNSRIQPRDIHRFMQTNKETSCSLSDAGLSQSESQRLIAEIIKHNDQYRIKFKDDTQVMECLFY